MNFLNDKNIQKRTISVEVHALFSPLRKILIIITTNNHENCNSKANVINYYHIYEQQID